MDDSTQPLRRRTTAAARRDAAALGPSSAEPHSHGRVRFAVTSALTFAYLVAELVVGYGAGSLTLQADAWHMMSDLGSLLVGYTAQLRGKAKQSAGSTYGGARYEVVGALINAVALIALALQIALEALSEVAKGVQEGPQPGVDAASAQLVMYVGAGGLAVNLIGLVLFRDAYGGHGHAHGGHGHAHGGGGGGEAPAAAHGGHLGHSHGGGSMNAQGVVLHLAGDALGSVAVIVSAAVMSLTSLPYRHLADPLASLVISILIALPAWRLARSSAAILLQHVPTGVDVPALRAALLQQPGVVAVHDLHVWELRPGVLVGGVHVGHVTGAVPGMCDAVKRVFHAAGVHATTVQLEPIDGELPSDAGAAGPELCEDLVCGTTCEAAACCPT
jgi:cation diffusion facilitator family transporter